ncbi:beta-lactamase family protein [Maribellus sp. CM-23]|uniref:serine hydrolase domain-containing protein n=1 Tax=Maribellus sp. CM-23 TaxID=2781026 RepID=UPI001F472754|nr:serine hydrolase domain-containing protein [Maribellus sp. CM-23]MCE4563386.1 beta-lactamase family protein [Maribellus sp. CM-23]
MKRSLLSLLGILFTLGVFSQTSKPVKGFSGALESATPEQSQLIVDNMLPFPDKTQLAIALIQSDSVLFTGIEQLNDTLHPTDNSLSIFEIGSISKVFTATLLANLVINETLGLDDRINCCIDIPLHPRDTFTLQQLANHTSGLPRLPVNLNLGAVDFRNPYRNYSEDDLLYYLTHDTTSREWPGKKYEYSNLGTGLLAYLLAQKEGSDYETMLRNYIFKKYVMNYSTTIREELTADLVPGLDAGGQVTPNWDFNILAGAGGILSNVSDLSKFAQAQFDPANTELALARQTTFEVNARMNIGLGWHILKSEDGRTWHWHNGGTLGYTSSMAVDIENKTAVVILSNVSAFHPKRQRIDELCFGLLKTLK